MAYVLVDDVRNLNFSGIIYTQLVCCMDLAACSADNVGFVQVFTPILPVHIYYLIIVVPINLF